MPKLPFAVRVPFSAVVRNDSLFHYLSLQFPLRRRDIHLLAVSFGFKNDERKFVKNLLERKRNYWAYRCNQKMFCGDFIIVDMSSPDIRRRKCWAIELKQNSPLKVGAGIGVQFKNLDLAIEEIANQSDILLLENKYSKVSGDRKLVTHFLQ